MVGHPATIRCANGAAIQRAHIPVCEWADFERGILGCRETGERVSALFGHAVEGGVELYAVLADDPEGRLGVTRTLVPGKEFPSLTPYSPQVHLFEREIAEQFGLVPVGHPWLKPVRYPASRDGRGASQIGVTDFYRVEGEEVHEVAVGPVHAGIIEPGHFRFQCHGEEVFHLEISLGYQHRGIEAAIAAGVSPNRLLRMMETVAGDTTIGHASAYLHAMESVAGGRVPARAQVLRAIGLELERLANHTGDLGALAGDVGFLPTQAYCGRLRGDLLNLTALVCGNRFGRGWLRPGGVAFDVDAARIDELRRRLQNTWKDVANAIRLLWDTPSVMERFETTGALSEEQGRQLGLVGPAARACGLARDVRNDHPLGAYRFNHLPVSTWKGGDVLARAYVRWMEIEHSVQFIDEQLAALPDGAIQADTARPRPGMFVASLVEGWRGEICHVALTDEAGRWERYKIVDPSFHNWSGLALALRNQAISDFPVCNKSFNLSYCGHDL